ncbi:MAG: histone deacetylase [Thermoguttaceae bacterium]|jgi:acetoin utilization deacetylase AcuC-like enzyme|nr:histone deacetylase [Thermoguttaceae bacterium]
MTLLYSDPRFFRHETGTSPERAERIRRIGPRLERAGLDRKCRRPSWKAVSRQRLGRIHSPRYIDEVWALSKSGGGDLDTDTVICPASYHVALEAVGAVCDATERLVRGEDTTALCLIRPPGHHAMASRAMGFCVFNNVAVAARVALDELGLDRVLIVDWDIHHGNGTQAAFWEDPRVGFLSIHRWPFYPGTGLEDETGSGPGLGYTLNLPVAYGTPRKDYLARFANALERFSALVKPQLVLLSAGFDTHRLDPVGDLGLETEDFVPLTTLVLDVADAYAQGRLVSVLEGGYHPEVMAECVELHLAELLKRCPNT